MYLAPSSGLHYYRLLVQVSFSTLYGLTDLQRLCLWHVVVHWVFKKLKKNWNTIYQSEIEMQSYLFWYQTDCKIISFGSHINFWMMFCSSIYSDIKPTAKRYHVEVVLISEWYRFTVVFILTSNQLQNDIIEKSY